jgi:hypothetical protein
MRKTKSIDLINSDEMWMNVDRIMCGGNPVVLIDRATFAPNVLRERVRAYDADIDAVVWKVARFYRIETVRGMDTLIEITQKDLEDVSMVTED